MAWASSEPLRGINYTPTFGPEVPIGELIHDEKIRQKLVMIQTLDLVSTIRSCSN